MGLLPMAGAGIDIAIVIIGYGYDARADRNILSLEALGIASAVPLLVVAADDVRNISKLRNVFQHAGPCDAVTLIYGQLPSG